MRDKTRIREVPLEIVRPGPDYGQLLSPLTNYVALCGDESPATIQINLEHWRLLNRLRNLRYVVVDRRQGKVSETPAAIREAEVHKLGVDVGHILGSIPTVYRQLGQDSQTGDELLHLRLVISGSELSLIPFELLIAPKGFPDVGGPLFLQKRLPITVTREVRRGQPIRFQWNRKPRILFVAAAPGGMNIPLKEHVWALRDSLTPWIQWEETLAKRLHHVKEYLTVLPDASLDEVILACAEEDYTYVHILAHGADYEQSGERHFGVALCDSHNKNIIDVVDGRKLAAALRTTKKVNSQPSVVTLSTCDSGNVGSVVAPGGSIAHDLHTAGIPWVFASQFPLTKRGSVKLTRNLYGRLLHGEDPRRVLHEVRNLMYLGERGDHDWASLIAYGSIPSSFSQGVSWFRARQTRDAINVDLDRASRAGKKEVEKSVKSARKRAADWRNTLPSQDSCYQTDHKIRVECLGISGATEKQLAELFYNEGDHDKELDALEKALDFYQQAVTEKADSYWPASQYLSLSAVLGRDPEPALWMETLHGVERNLMSSDQVERAWTYGTIAELELLGVYHLCGIDRLEKTPAKVKKLIIDHFKKIVDLAGRDSFNVFSTRRQFTRYCEWWNGKLPELADIARPALKHLPKGKNNHHQPS